MRSLAKCVNGWETRRPWVTRWLKPLFSKELCSTVAKNFWCLASGSNNGALLPELERRDTAIDFCLVFHCNVPQPSISTLVQFTNSSHTVVTNPFPTKSLVYFRLWYFDYFIKKTQTAVYIFKLNYPFYVWKDLFKFVVQIKIKECCKFWFPWWPISVHSCILAHWLLWWLVCATCQK